MLHAVAELVLLFKTSLVCLWYEAPGTLVSCGGLKLSITRIEFSYSSFYMNQFGSAFKLEFWYSQDRCLKIDPMNNRGVGFLW